MEHLPGFREFFPEPIPSGEAWSAAVREHLFERWHAVARRYGFQLYDGPPVEPLELYTAKSGAEIAGQLYHFTDKGGREVSLRPEMTPTVARMVAARERHYKKPLKWYSIPQLFRYERQQKGRLREHFQLNADIFGETNTAADAELIALLIDLLRAFGLSSEDFVIRLSSRNVWQDFYRRHGNSPDRAYDFFQVVDKLERNDPAQSDATLRELGLSLEAVRAFIAQGAPTVELQAVLDNLAARGLAEFVRVDYTVIRGLAYYTGIVYEAFDRHGKFRAIAGGGRYDELVTLVSGGRSNVPAAGFAIGDVVLTELLKERGKLPAIGERLDAYLMIEDESRRGESLSLLQRLRDAGMVVDFSLTPAKPDKQFKRAQEAGAAFTLALDAQLRVRVRHLATREEAILPHEGVETHLRSKLA